MADARNAAPDAVDTAILWAAVLFVSERFRDEDRDRDLAGAVAQLIVRQGGAHHPRVSPIVARLEALLGELAGPGWSMAEFRLSAQVAALARWRLRQALEAVARADAARDDAVAAAREVGA